MKHSITLLAIWLLVLYQTTYVISDDDSCGVPNEPPNQSRVLQERIVGGADVGYYKYPWYAILESVGTRRLVICGGTLISKKHVLTAAHCYKDLKISLTDAYQVALGVYNNCDSSDQNRKVYTVEKVKVHENYKRQDPWYDIALLTLAEEVDFMPICLPERGARLPEYVVVTGYGVLTEGNLTEPCEQQEVEVKTFDRGTCIKMLQRHEGIWNYFNTRPIKAFCAGYLEGKKDSCQGDSGGPLSASEDGIYTLYGVVSFGYGCARKNALGVYTEVSEYIDWINANMAGGKKNTGPGPHKKRPNVKKPQRKPNHRARSIRTPYQRLKTLTDHGMARTHQHNRRL